LPELVDTSVKSTRRTSGNEQLKTTVW